MFGSSAIGVAIGLVFVYLLMSMLCSMIREVIAGLLNSRARHLEAAIGRMIADDELRDQFFEHPMIKSLHMGHGGKHSHKPDFIPPKTFSMALLDVVKRQTQATASADNATTSEAPAPPITFDEIRNTIDKLPPKMQNIKTALQTLADSSEQRVDSIHSNVEEWFDTSMSSLSVWYQRRAQQFLFLIALCLSFGFHVDSIEIAEQFWEDSTLRESVVAAATEYTKEHKEASSNPEDLRQTLSQLTDLKLPIGWGRQVIDWTPGVEPEESDVSDHRDRKSGWLMLVGLFITAAACSVGSPFWFSVLKRLMTLHPSAAKVAKAKQASSASDTNAG